MPNFVKILRKIKKFPIQGLASDCSACMAAICYSSPISAFPTNEQLLSEKSTGARFQIDSLKTCLFIYRQMDRQTDMAKSSQLVMLIIYVYIL